MPTQRAPLTIAVERQPGGTLVRLAGAVTIDEADRLNKEMRRLASESGPRLVLDLHRLEFICSMGLGALIVAHIICRRRDAELVLVAPQPPIREVLTTTRLDKVFPLASSITEAMK